MKLDFAKLHGLGNDFVIINDLDASLELTGEQVSFICDRHFGVGADGVILVRPSARQECSAYMHYINSDGTLAEMCGNGIRCFTKYLVDRRLLPPKVDSFIADTKRGPLSITFKRDSQGAMETATVDMDEPILDPALVPTTLCANAKSDAGFSFVKEAAIASPWGTFNFTCVSMGNPHAICFLDNLDDLPEDWFTAPEKTLASFDLNRIGAYFECHEAFPAKTNVEFIVPKTDGLHMRVFERGCGETLACGTGACASLVAGALTGRCSSHSFVHLRGGSLEIEWGANNHVMMCGPAVQSFTGTLEL